jgi:thiamine-monophosphate kinase
VARSPGPLLLDVTAIGRVKPRRILARRGAAQGDGIYVSGTLGAAHAGWLTCRGGAPAPAADVSDPCVVRFLTPEPRVRLGLLLGRNRVASSCVDLSDGLGDAVRQMADANGVGAMIDAGALPVPDEARRRFEEAGLDPVLAAIGGGEDYELLFTVPARRRRALAAVMKLAGGVPCTRIGTVTAGTRLILRRGPTRGPLPGGFAHFR